MLDILAHTSGGMRLRWRIDGFRFPPRPVGIPYATSPAASDNLDPIYTNDPQGLLTPLTCHIRLAGGHLARGGGGVARRQVRLCRVGRRQRRRGGRHPRTRTVRTRVALPIGLGCEAATPAEAEGLIRVGAQVTFRHPLVRSAIQQAATPEECRSAHRALAEAIDPEVSPDRRAWHRAEAAVGPDEEVAGDLERSAGQAHARGGVAAAAAFLERSAALTADPGRRAERRLAAAGPCSTPSRPRPRRATSPPTSRVRTPSPPGWARPHHRVLGEHRGVSPATVGSAHRSSPEVGLMSRGSAVAAAAGIGP